LFVHLHNHTEFSLLDGATRVKKMVEKASSQGMPAVAITDHGVMYGAVEFYKAARNAGIKPIIGCEVYVAPRTRFDREHGKDDSQYHLVLLARNREGYRNLMKLVTAGYMEGFYYKPRVDRQLLAEHSRGLFALSACLAGEIPALLLKGEGEKAYELACWYRDTFEPGHYFLELQDQGLEEQYGLNQKLFQLGERAGIPLVATNDVHYLDQEDAEAHDVLLCIQTGKNVDDPNRMKFEGNGFYFKSSEEMKQTFADFPNEVLENTAWIAEQVELEFDFDQMLLPPYTIPAPHNNAEEYLQALCLEGLENRYDEITPEIKERLDFELGVINQMGYASYFLIVWDFIRFAQEKSILVGPGRGSAAGSLVAYALNITNIDPLRYGLLFERFLNPERVTMPDIDIDFCYERRDEVIRYVVDKYGEDRVAQIITFGTMAARLAVRDVGRALNFSYGETDRVAKMIPYEVGMSIEKALTMNNDLKSLYNSDERYRRLLDTSMAVEGLPRHSSTHAAGVVIAGDPLVEHVPLQKATDDSVVTQFSMGNLEELGLLKMDFLGLRTLTIIGEAARQANLRGADLDINNVSLDDASTFTLLSQGETAGVFQLESSGMRSVLRELKPSKFEDIIAVVALYRPGPMEQIPVFIESKHGVKPIKYLHPDLEPILKETYGVMVYQEQIMEVAARMAGFTLGQADLLRRAIGKKKMEILDEQRVLFVDGVEKTGYDRKLGEDLYNLIVKFASYGFNKSHAAAYAMVAYQTAYLKANYPVEFMAALLTGVMSTSEKVALYIASCKRMGIEVLPPDVNESDTNFTVVGENRIRFGLAAVKNVGRGAIETIIHTREKEGKFNGLNDFCQKVDLRACNRKVIESLIKSGAFDSLGGLRSQYLNILESALARGQQAQKERLNGQLTMLSFLGEEENMASSEDELPPLPEFSAKEKLTLEKEMVGLYISGHPLDQYRLILDNVNQVIPLGELAEVGDRRNVSVAGIISAMRQIYTKKGQPMCFITIEDLTGDVEVVVFSDVYERYQDELEEDRVVILQGQSDHKEDDDVKILCKDITFLPKEAKQLLIKVCGEKPIGDMVALKDVLAEYQGGMPVYLYFEDKKKLLLTGQECWVKEDNRLYQRIESLVGPDCLKVQQMEA